MSAEVPGATTAAPVLNAAGLTRTYQRGPEPVEVLRGIDLVAEPGAVVVIQGRSGSGKTTLLGVLGGLDDPTEGTVAVAGQPLGPLDEGERAELRRHTIGFVFQSFGLIPMLNARENVEVPLRLVRSGVGERRRRSGELLERVGLDHRAAHRPSELSGGEQQRVAIARALANEPRLLLAGRLDSETARTVISLLADLVRDQGIAAVIATHDPAMVAVADRVLRLEDGRLVPTH